MTNTDSKKVMFIFDRVFHYHEPTFVQLDDLLRQSGHRLILASGQTTCSGKEIGRVGITRKVVDEHYFFLRHEFKVLGYTLRYWRKIFPIIREHRPDIIVIPSHVGNIYDWLLMCAKPLFAYKLVAWQCGYEYNKSAAKDNLLRLFLNGFDFHLAYHTNAKNYGVEHGVPEEKITVIHNTIDESRIKRVEQSLAREQLEKIHSDIQGNKIILFVGAILREKKLDLLIDAFNELNSSHVVLLIVGDGEDLGRIMDRCKGNENILFPGQVVDDVGIYFDASDIFVLPGTGGLGINEAMAHGLPIISGYADGSADDLVKDGVNGFRLEDYSVEELSRHLKFLLHNEKERKRMGENSLEMILGELSFKEFIARVYRGLLKFV